MTELELLIDLHLDAERQGPGSREATLRAIELAGLDRSRRLAVADLGCGTGASAIVLASALEAHVTGVDLVPEFTAALADRARREGLADAIEARTGPIEELPFDDDAFDVIWSEGAIYNIGFERGVRAWRRFLKPGGVLAVTEITWRTEDRPEELETFWTDAYPEIDTASSKISVLERNGYSPLAYFVLPRDCWTENYYRPLLRRFPEFLDRHSESPEARALVDSERREIELFERFGDRYGYGFYIARRQD